MILRTRPLWKRVLRLPLTFYQHYRIARQWNGPVGLSIVCAFGLALASVQRVNVVKLRAVHWDPGAEEVLRAAIRSVTEEVKR